MTVSALVEGTEEAAAAAWEGLSEAELREEVRKYEEAIREVGRDLLEVKCKNFQPMPRLHLHQPGEGQLGPRVHLAEKVAAGSNIWRRTA